MTRRTQEGAVFMITILLNQTMRTIGRGWEGPEFGASVSSPGIRTYHPPGTLSMNVFADQQAHLSLSVQSFYGAPITYT